MGLHRHASFRLVGEGSTHIHTHIWHDDDDEHCSRVVVSQLLRCPFEISSFLGIEKRSKNTIAYNVYSSFALKAWRISCTRVAFALFDAHNKTKKDSPC